MATNDEMNRELRGRFAAERVTLVAPRENVAVNEAIRSAAGRGDDPADDDAATPPGPRAGALRGGAYGPTDYTSTGGPVGIDAMLREEAASARRHGGRS